MGMFDFIKKTELNTIRELNERLESNKKEIDSLYNDLASAKSEHSEQVLALKDEINSLKTQHQRELLQRQEAIKKLDDTINQLNSEYVNALDLYKKLKYEVGLFENKLDIIEHGIYVPIYDYEKSDDYRVVQNELIDRQKALVKEDRATICNTEWSLGNSRVRGEAMTKLYKKLLLRAFNGESDVIIAKVRWNNINQSIEKIKYSHSALNRLGEKWTTYITDEYLNLKLEELRLEHEFREKVRREKEELRASNALLREEEFAQREYERALKEAEKEEAIYQKALDKARSEVTHVTGVDQTNLLEQIKRLELELIEAQNKKERALSMAQQTRRGHIYIISNVGAFGDSIYKIGMTRRLEPLDRVKELGDASVPFSFDVHAMIYSEDAPRLESELHNAFSDKRVNLLNQRKEFFRISFDEIRQKVIEVGVEADFTILPEAREYYETLSLLHKINSDNGASSEIVVEDEFPSSLR